MIVALSSIVVDARQREASLTSIMQSKAADAVAEAVSGPIDE